MNKMGRYATGLFLIAGCAHHQGSTSLQPRAGAATLTTNQVIQIAKGAVAKNDNWAERATYDASHETNGWSVMVWRIVGYDQNGKPLFVPGGHRLIQIDDQGQIKNYFRGE